MRSTTRSGYGIAALLTLLVASTSAAEHPRHPAAHAAGPVAIAFTHAPKVFVLTSPYTEARPLIEARSASGAITDVTDKVVWSFSSPAIAKMEGETLTPLHDGRTRLIARLGSAHVEADIAVSGIAKAGPPRFLTDVLPVITKAGCNQGACHGSASGKGGFKLSLLGYDPDWDYDAITRASDARRICLAAPESSLLLRKPTFRVRHRGGRIFDESSHAYRVLRDWIAAGVPGPGKTEPKVVDVEISPAVRTLPVGQSQVFAVRAKYSDGTTRDVTNQALFTASDAAVAAVQPLGSARVTGTGEAAVLIRYGSLVKTASVISPFAAPRACTAAKPTTDSDAIDALIDRKLASLGLNPSARCTDSDFLRRAYLDLIGQLPTADEVRAFLADRTSDRRSRLIDSLMARPEYVDFWTVKWGDLLHCSRDLLTDRGMNSLHAWIRRSVQNNVPWDQFARDLLLARGSVYANGPANFYRTSGNPGVLAETTSQLFLGVRIECARCHNHPYERWTQNQYYQMAAFFARVKTQAGSNDDRVVYTSNDGEVHHPKTNATVLATALDASPLPATYAGDRREPLADWLTSARNPFFSYAFVNRIWKHLMGRGFVEPVDDLRVTNPPSNAPLFDWLSADFSRHGFDVKYLIKTIMLTRAYQRSAEPAPGAARDVKFYSHSLLKRLGAEQLIDALSSGTGVPSAFDGYPQGIRACQLPDTTVPSYFLDLFGRPERKTTCECERSDAPTIAQVLHFMNGKDINDRITAKNGIVSAALDAKHSDAQVVEQLYLSTVSRYPTAAESRRAVSALAHAKDRRKITEDLLWVLLNSNEFLFNH
jgi:hypothetical protein